MAHRKKYFLLMLLFCMVFVSTSFAVKAQDQSEDYKVGFDVGTELVWEITELDKSNFKIIFGPDIEPNFEVGDQIRIVIRGIREFTIQFVIEYDFWDYKTDWALPGKSMTYNLLKYPYNYNFTSMTLTPVEDFLAEAATFLPSEYTVIGSTVIKQGISNQGKDYRIEKEYDIRGIVAVETWYDQYDQVFIRSEGTFRISFGLYFVGFTIVGMLGLMTILIKKKRFTIKN